MELQVTLTLSDRLFTLLEDKLPSLGRRIEKAVTKEIGAQVRRTSNTAIAVKVDAPETTAAQPVVAEEAVEPQKESPVPPAVSEAAAKAEILEKEKSRNLGVEIREIMHRTRQRFEGEDYKENTDSEYYKKYHRACTSMFKQIAVTLGYEKPSLIDDPQKVDAFAAECDALIIGENGFIAPPPAPY